MTIIRNVVFLIFAIIIGFLGIKFSAYGLMVNAIDNSLHEISLEEVTQENLKTKRYLKITDGVSFDFPIEYVDGRGQVSCYIYPLLKMESNDSIFALQTNIIIESKEEINDWKAREIKGLLKPYWYNIDDEIIQEFQYRGITVDENSYYLELDARPLKWYWYLLILLIAALFFYRMIEAMIKGIKKKTKT